MEGGARPTLCCCRTLVLCRIRAVHCACFVRMHGLGLPCVFIIQFLALVVYAVTDLFSPWVGRACVAVSWEPGRRFRPDTPSYFPGRRMYVRTLPKSIVYFDPVCVKVPRLGSSVPNRRKQCRCRAVQGGWGYSAESFPKRHNSGMICEQYLPSSETRHANDVDVEGVGFLSSRRLNAPTWRRHDVFLCPGRQQSAVRGGHR